MTDTELAELFVETSKRHHAAFIEADGVDPEWPLFYAGIRADPAVGPAGSSAHPQ